MKWNSLKTKTSQIQRFICENEKMSRVKKQRKHETDCSRIRKGEMRNFFSQMKKIYAKMECR